jgi:putative Holliday junction resolvase
MKKRIIGIDYGSKRVGVSISDPEQKFALPLTVLDNSALLLKEIEKIIKDNEVSKII